MTQKCSYVWILLMLAAAGCTPPLADEALIPEQIGLDVQAIKTLHVSSLVNAVEG